MNLFILRHGLAVPHGSPGYAEDERPLTPEGERKLRCVADAMAALKLSFDLILSSPFPRARQTAELVAESLGMGKVVEFSETLTPDGSQRKLIEFLAREKRGLEDVLLVGHEPHLSSLISLLVSGDAGSTVVMKKGGLCKLSVEALKAGRCAALEWLLTPKQMALMA